MSAPLYLGASLCRHSTPGQSHPCSAGDLLRLQGHETNFRSNQLAGNGGQHHHHGGLSDSDYCSADIVSERLSRDFWRLVKPEQHAPSQVVPLLRTSSSLPRVHNTL